MTRTIKVLAMLTAFFMIVSFYGPVKSSLVGGENEIGPDGISTEMLDIGPVAFSSTVPSDVPNGYNATQEELGVFAWQEFIALNWPAKKNSSPSAGESDYFRGQPSTGKLGSTGSGGVVVWETFQHRVELYPGYPFTGGPFKLPSINSKPNYQYPSYVKIMKPAGVDTTLFNNLDEASEISLCDMYFTPFAEQVDSLRNLYGMTPTTAQANEIEAAAIKAGIVYEAKANPTIYNYVKKKGFNNNTPRTAAAQNTVKLITNNSGYNPSKPHFDLPSGSIEMKATWRRYDSSLDDLSEYHWTKGIYYVGEMQQNGSILVAQNDTFLLIGLHIIHKTPNVPSFTFATFEHVTNEKYGFRFKNTHPEDVTTKDCSRKLPDDGIKKAIRQYPIPAYAKTLNASIQKQLRTDFGNDIVWANYQLIGVQAKVQNDPDRSVPDQEFFLSNFATETNDALQFFQGGLTGTFANVPNPDAAKVAVLNTSTNKYETFTMGGCSGCHGAQGQAGGFDFSVISAKGNFFSPEAIEEYPIGAVSDQDPKCYPLPHGAF